MWKDRWREGTSSRSERTGDSEGKRSVEEVLRQQDLLLLSSLYLRAWRGHAGTDTSFAPIWACFIQRRNGQSGGAGPFSLPRQRQGGKEQIFSSDGGRRVLFRTTAWTCRGEMQHRGRRSLHDETSQRAYAKVRVRINHRQPCHVAQPQRSPGRERMQPNSSG